METYKVITFTACVCIDESFTADQENINAQLIEFAGRFIEDNEGLDGLGSATFEARIETRTVF